MFVIWHKAILNSLSIGVIACDVESGASLDKMIEEADRRMYQAKGEKRRAQRNQNT